MAKAHRDVTGAEPRIGMHAPARFFGSDAAHLAAAGMTGLLYGPGGRYNTMPDERVDVPDFLDAVRIYLLAILDVCEPA